ADPRSIANTRSRDAPERNPINPMTTATTNQIDEDSFADLLEQSLLDSNVKEGSIVRGTVVDIIGDYAVVDVGLKAEGQVPLREFADEDGNVDVKIGDVIEVLLEHAEDMHGLVVLSKDKARKRKVWDEIQSAMEEDGIVKGQIQAR